MPTRQQEQILWYLIEMLPRFNGGAMDATGPGQTLAEYTGDKFGECIHQIVLTRKWYGEWMPKMVGAFEDGSLELPKDKSTSDDFRAVEIIDGIPMVPHIDKRDIKDPELFRHGDTAIAGALMWYASLHRTIEAFGYRPVPKNPPLNGDQPKRRVRVTAGFSRGVLCCLIHQSLITGANPLKNGNSPKRLPALQWLAFAVSGTTNPWPAA